ncbi:hypothetical protein [Rhizobium laguerreae]|uniref:Uncharacterized protein n=1 Tax=Rhizobium laguerreae TaxID=1076926 RepID=A0AAX2QRV4_9HYPH|nr:hypothetical protein [Rhizobium laguerreae]MBB3160126.1 hypothetical protein [Rhizobium laguerreae]MBY3065480.1 hypothetical protein [Rhizobium laguerreae]MBY3076653.1 hypothetical protein [Rhizobium laguerreae]MBY3111684.1 hypothetical protein [Rhizobium laguerreae]MBY3132366.1 hypothetical protein [Rhizobium laguerreae]
MSIPSRQRMPQDARGGNGDDDIKTEIPTQKILAGAALKAAGYLSTPFDEYIELSKRTW